MTTQWYFRLGEEELGPVTFQDLVDLARSGVLNEDSLVRSSWNENAQRADSVIGLMYMSRLPVAARDAQPAKPVDESSSPVESSTIEPEQVSRPEWLERLLQLGNMAQPNGVLNKFAADDAELDSQAALNNSASDFVSASTLSSEVTESALGFDQAGGADRSGDGRFVRAVDRPTSWTGAIDAALSQVDSRYQRSANRPRPRVWHICARIVNAIRYVVETREIVSPAFRIGSAVVVANLAAFWIQQWSERQELRFPKRPGEMQAPTFEFPLIGACSSTEYTILMFHFVILCGGCAYGAATYLESRAE